MEKEAITNAVVVGHSVSGVWLQLLATQAAQRIARVVFLNAIVLKDGESFVSNAVGPAQVRCPGSARQLSSFIYRPSNGPRLHCWTPRLCWLDAHPDCRLTHAEVCIYGCDVSMQRPAQVLHAWRDAAMVRTANNLPENFSLMLNSIVLCMCSCSSPSCLPTHPSPSRWHSPRGR